MMTSRRVITYVTAEPFQPFRINMVSGKSYGIRHPEMIAVGRTTVHVYMAISDDDEEAKQGEQELSIILVESIEPLDLTVKQDQHGN